MRFTLLRSLRPITSLAMVFLVGCATKATPVDDLGNGVQAMTRRSTYFSGRVDDLRVQVELEALAYCQRSGQALAVLESRATDPGPPVFPSATVQFRCVAP